MAKTIKYPVNIEDVRAAYIRGIAAGREEILTEIWKTLKIDEYVVQKIQEHEESHHSEP